MVCAQNFRGGDDPNGPEAEHLKLEGDWKERLARAIAKKRPEGGWPKPEKKKRDQKKQADASS